MIPLALTTLLTARFHVFERVKRDLQDVRLKDGVARSPSRS